MPDAREYVDLWFPVLGRLTVGGFDLALDAAGMECLWQVEQDKYCLGVLEHHWPNVPRFTDVTKVGAHDLARPDLIVGGFPCQDVSLAGHRKGLDGARSGLWWEFHRILDELRPRWVVIENVAGLLSSNGGRDMGAILGALGDLGYGFAYRVLDAQFFGVPQRRKRVFIVGCLADGARAGEVLLEPEGVRGSAAPGGEAWAAVARALADRSADWSGEGEPLGPVSALTTAFGGAGPDAAHAAAGWLIPYRVNGAHVGGAEHADVANTLDTRSGKNGAVSNQGGMAVLHAVEALSFNQRDEPRFSDKMYTLQAQPGADEQLVMHKIFAVQSVSAKVEPNTLVARDAADEPAEALTAGFSKRSDRGTLIVPVAVSFRGRDGEVQAEQESTDKSPTLRACSGSYAIPSVVVPFRKSARARSTDGYETWVDDGVANTLTTFDVGDVRTTTAVVETAATLTTRYGKGVNSTVDDGAYPVTDAKVRRLTPMECERLQGFPSVSQTVTVDVCIERHENRVSAGTPSPRSPRRVGNAGRDPLPESALSAGLRSLANDPSNSKHALPLVQLHSEGNVVELRSHGRLLWSASSAGTPSSSAPPTLTADAAHVSAGISSIVGLLTPAGGGDSLTIGTSSTTHLSGVVLSGTCGEETTPPVSDATSDTRTEGNPTRFTTSNRSASSRTERDAATLCCSVVSAIAGFIPEEIQSGRFLLEVTEVRGWTEVGIFDGKAKPLSDTQRYRQMGNAVAVPVVYWIAVRLAALSREDERTQRSANPRPPARPGRSSRVRRRARPRRQP